MNKYMKYAALCLALGLVFVGPDALAQTAKLANTNPFTTTLAVLVETFKNVRAVIYVAGGFALVGMAVASMVGKLAWKWLAAVAIALAIVAMSGAIVDYATGQQARTAGDARQFDDTLNN